jgi:hypothetical protein
MDTLISIAGTFVVFVLIAMVFVVIDFKIMVPFFVFLRPKDNRPKPEESKGITARQSPKWQFWLSVSIALVSLWPVAAAGTLDFFARIVSMWAVFLGAKSVVSWWDNQDKIFGAVGEFVKGNPDPVREAVAAGSAKFQQLRSEKTSLLDRVRGWVGKMLVGAGKIKQEFGDVRSEYAQPEQAPTASSESGEPTLPEAPAGSSPPGELPKEEPKKPDPREALGKFGGAEGNKKTEGGEQ